MINTSALSSYLSGALRCLPVLLLFCWGAVLTATPCAADQAKPWRVGTWKTAQTIQPYYWRDFTDQAVEVFPFTNPADQKAALLAGSLDICGTTLAHAIASAARGEPVVVVASLCNKASALVVGRKAPIHDPADLKGRTIGYVPGTMHEILLRELLFQHGLNPRHDVTLQRVDFFDMGTALAKGAIDAFLSGEPFPSLAVHQGYGRILSYPYFEEQVGTINAALLTTRQAVAERPDLVQAQVEAHARATEYLRGHEDAWLDAAAAFGTEREVLVLAADNIELVWDMDEAYVRRVAALGRRMHDLGLIDREPDYAALVDLQFVQRRKQGP